MAALIAAGTFSVAANIAAGTQPSRPTQIPDSAFHAVVLPSGAPGAGASPSMAPVRVPDRLADVPVLADPFLASPPPERAQPSLAAPTVVVRNVAPPAPATSHSITGRASWYCRAGWSPCTVNHPDDGGVDAYAAAGPRLRAAIGPTWRGHVISVDGMRVKLIDWCQCYKGEPNEKLLDLYYDVFARVGSNVTIRW